MNGLKQQLIIGVTVFFFILGCWPADIKGQTVSAQGVRPVLAIRTQDTTSIELLSFTWTNSKNRNSNFGDFTVRVLNPDQRKLKVCIMVRTKGSTDEQQWCTDKPELFKQISDTTLFTYRQILTINAATAAVSVTEKEAK